MTISKKAKQREQRTKELPLKYQVQAYITKNPEASLKKIADHFGITKGDVATILEKLKNKRI